jgi:hypothetical protein
MCIWSCRIHTLKWIIYLGIANPYDSVCLAIVESRYFLHIHVYVICIINATGYLYILTPKRYTDNNIKWM